MNKELIERIEKIFIQKLSDKTNWGRNEVMNLYRDSVKDALFTLIE